MVKQAVLDGAQARATTREGERVAEEILRMLDRPAHRFRGFIRGPFAVSRSKKGVEVKLTKDRLIDVRLVEKKRRYTTRGNIQILAAVLTQEGGLLSALIQVF